MVATEEDEFTEDLEKDSRSAALKKMWLLEEVPGWCGRAFQWRQKTELVFIETAGREGGLTAIRYVEEILGDHVVPYADVNIAKVKEIVTENPYST